MPGVVIPAAPYVSERDTSGNPVPTHLAHAFTYDNSLSIGAVVAVPLAVYKVT